ncbi:MAG: hypothetical protein GC138_04080 [Gammaproteobacteria bacterium]|nr:hypothetical protein [Gammaproteobacteria bacterium]
MNPAIYDVIEHRVAEDGNRIDRACLGLTWSYCRSGERLGLAMSPGEPCRILPWPGTIRGKTLVEVAAWLRSWNGYEACLGLAAANAVINHAGNPLMQAAEALPKGNAGNLAVFEYLRPRLLNRRVVVIGRYPGIEGALEGVDFQVLERRPGEGDLPDTAAETLLPEADWVFITATSLINKSFPRLAELSRDAVSVLMGPSTPWLAEFADWGIDFLAGVRIADVELAIQVAEEGGGTRLFDDAVNYALLDIGQNAMRRLKEEIAATAARRAALKQAMEAWYAAGNRGRFPEYRELETIDAKLSALDLRYRRQWDARHR